MVFVEWQTGHHLSNMLLFHIHVVCNQSKLVREGVDGTVGYKGSVPTGVQPSITIQLNFPI